MAAESNRHRNLRQAPTSGERRPLIPSHLSAVAFRHKLTAPQCTPLLDCWLVACARRIDVSDPVLGHGV